MLCYADDALITSNKNTISKDTIMDLDFTFDAELWLYSGPTQWHFITLPVDIADEIKFFIKSRNGFGSIRLSATVGTTKWKTSIFPYKEANSFIMPMKKDVRVREGLHLGGVATVNIYIPIGL